jgi:biopolymer transport protein ExbD
MHRPPHALHALSIGALAATLVVGCGEKKVTSSQPSAKPSASPAVTAAQQPPRPKTMPDLLVDPEGPYLGGQRIDLVAAGGREKLTQVVKDLPIDGKPVTLLAEKKAKIQNVAAVVAELGKAGAPKITIKTDGRDDLPKEIVVTPENRVTSPPACSVSAMVIKDLSTAVWPFAGGVGRRHRKGFAGPDLSHTGEQLKKDLSSCESTIAFFSSDETIPWEMAYNLAGTIMVSDDKKKIDTLVLLREIPVAGRPVTLAK